MVLAAPASEMSRDKKIVALREFCAKTSCTDCKLYPCKPISGNDKQLDDEYNKIMGNNVDHPQHYQGKYECIDEMVALFGVEAVKAFCKCNIYKYRYRSDRKNGAEDIEKAEWYMGKLMELENG